MLGSRPLIWYPYCYTLRHFMTVINVIEWHKMSFYDIYDDHKMSQSIAIWVSNLPAWSQHLKYQMIFIVISKKENKKSKLIFSDFPFIIPFIYSKSQRNLKMVELGSETFGVCLYWYTSWENIMCTLIFQKKCFFDTPYWGLGIGIGFVNWRLRLVIGIWDWQFEIEDLDWGLRLGIGIGIWHQD